MSAILYCETPAALKWFTSQSGVSVVCTGYLATSFPKSLAQLISFVAPRTGLAVAPSSAFSEVTTGFIALDSIFIFRGSTLYWRNEASTPRDGASLAVEIMSIALDKGYLERKQQSRDKEVIEHIIKAMKKPEPEPKPKQTQKPISEDPYVTLGVSPGCTLEQLRAARNARLAEYHPDKVAKLGKKIQEIAEAETKKINLAYEQLSPKKVRPSKK